MLARIAHKHVSVGITADQYKIVHEYLFEAIAEVLGEAVTPEVAAAWDEVYWLMANALIAMESRLYDEAGRPAGEVWSDYRVVAVLPETAEVTTYVVEPFYRRTPLPRSRPGQYVSVQMTLPDGARQLRQYSLSGVQDGHLRFSVKRLPATAAAPEGEVSNHLHDRVRPGDVLRMSDPAGDVFLDETSDRRPWCSSPRASAAHP